MKVSFGWPVMHLKSQLDLVKKYHLVYLSLAIKNVGSEDLNIKRKIPGYSALQIAFNCPKTPDLNVGFQHDNAPCHSI